MNESNNDEIEIKCNNFNDCKNNKKKFKNNISNNRHCYEGKN